MARRVLETLEKDPTNPELGFEANLTWDVAQLAQYQVGDFVTARNFYRRLMAAYPGDQRIFMAKQRIAEMDRMKGKARP